MQGVTEIKTMNKPPVSKINEVIWFIQNKMEFLENFRADFRCLAWNAVVCIYCFGFGIARGRWCKKN